MTTHNAPTRTSPRRALAWLVLLPLLVSLTPPVHAAGLRARLNSLLGRKQQAQAQIRVAKKQQAAATDRLWDAQKQLGAAQRRLTTARGQLAKTSADLAAAQTELARLEKRMDQHESDVQDHLLALYKSGQPGYLNVVMQADSFSDFSNRNRFVSALVNQDEYLLNWLSKQKDEADQARAALEQKKRQRLALVQEISRDETTARQKQGEVKQILHDANAKRAAAEEMLAEQEQEENQVQAMIRARMAHGGGGGGGYGGSYSGTWSGGFLRPADGSITSPFGMRVHPITGVYKLHTGVDIGAGYGSTVRAAAKGLVISTGWEKAYGQTVIIDHGSGMHTWYCHLSAVLVSEGTLVNRGQPLGRVGSTGMSTGPHLHFGVLKNGDWVNPLGY